MTQIWILLTPGVPKLRFDKVGKNTGRTQKNGAVSRFFTLSAGLRACTNRTL
jgi:hypothetical protein